VTEKSPTPPNRQDPHLDSADDAGEPAFEWMKPAGAGKRSDAASGAPETERTAVAPDAEPTAATQDAEPTAAAPVPVDPAGTPAAGERQGRRAERKAADDAAAGAATPAGAAGTEEFNESLPTSALQVRPPREEVERRNAERDHAANAKPVAPRVMQVLLAVCYPVILLVLAVRAVTSPLFLWVEYNRPGFPGDGYGFNTDDRMTYGSYAVDYLSNWSGPRYLGELVNRSGEPLFKDGEVSHMADVKLVILSAFGAGALLVVLSLVAILYLRRRSTGGVRRGLFAGSIVTLVIIVGLGVLAVLGWEQFFTEFHRVFFANGTWTFSLQDTLIRLFPGQFWVDAGIVIGALVLLAALLTLILTWPTRKRRGLPPRVRNASAAEDAGDVAADPAELKGRRFKRSRNGAVDGPAGRDADAGTDAGSNEAAAARREGAS
jgi:integral membrane protein (TIGR01906 family)